jgi:hypothetical protein
MQDKEARVRAAMQSFMRSLQQLDREYVELMQRCGVRSIPLHRI